MALHEVEIAHQAMAAGDASGGGAEYTEIAADGDHFRGDGAAGFDGEAVLGGTARVQIRLERGGAAQGVRDAGQDHDGVPRAEMAEKEGVVRVCRP